MDADARFILTDVFLAGGHLQASTQPGYRENRLLISINPSVGRNLPPSLSYSSISSPSRPVM
jgi:hypothetical protein